MENTNQTNNVVRGLVIIGGGPAGSAAAVYAARKKIKSTILTIPNSLSTNILIIEIKPTNPHNFAIISDKKT